MGDNNITLMGNLTRDPELRYTQSGQGICSFGMAVGRRYQVNGEWQEKTSFFNVVAWGALGENVAASFSKGNRIIVTGELEQRSYETQEGEKRSVVEVKASDVGASMKWARVQIERVVRSSTESGGQSSGPFDGPAGGGAEVVPMDRNRNRPPDPVYGDEEFF
jgi:single-strand DNA-binding protein